MTKMFKIEDAYWIVGTKNDGKDAVLLARCKSEEEAENHISGIEDGNGMNLLIVKVLKEYASLNNPWKLIGRS